jgi:release factor glutamine methyltransferase
LVQRALIIRIGDLFEPFATEKFDIIISNPPYIPNERALEDSVTQHEPAEALRGGTDGLDIIRRIAAEAPSHLNPGGELWMEVDAPTAEESRTIIERTLGTAALYPDQYGRPRLVVGHYNQ